MTKQARLPVIFRRWPASEGGGVIALFPTLVGTNDPYTCESYERIGQHGAAEPVGLIQRTKAATPAEYTSLLKELHSIGYRNLDIKQRYQYSYLEDRRRELARLVAPSKTKYAVGKGASKSGQRAKGSAELGGTR